MSQEIHEDEEKVLAEGLHEDACRMSQEIHDEEKVAGGLDDEDEWMNCMREKLVSRSDDGPSHEEHLIYRVHSTLRSENPSCYEPIATSIGPYHNGKEQLLDMETHKKRYLRHLLSRNKNVRFEDLVNKMKNSEDRVRKCYPEEIKLDSKAFIEMMLLDACFIVELLLKCDSRTQRDDLIDGPNWRFTNLVNHDLLLLENQLPFFLLQEIFQVVMSNKEDPKQAFVQLSLKFLGLINPIEPGTGNEEVLSIAPESVHHLLHLWYTRLIPSAVKQTQDSKISKSINLSLCLGMCNCCKGKTLGKFNCCRGKTLGMPNFCGGKTLGMPNFCRGKILGAYNCCRGKTLGKLDCCKDKGKTVELERCVWMPGVTELKESGIEFKASSNNLLEINFCNGEMIIPMLYVQDETETHLRNLIAFEQCSLTPSSPRDYYFSSYAVFLDYLINTSKDVEILHRKGIFMHWLGEDEEVAQLFNKLTKRVLVDWENSYLYDTYRRVNKYRSRKIHKWRASLVRDYFYSPWAVLSFIAAIIALSLTAIQTVYSVDQPKK